MATSWEELYDAHVTLLAQHAQMLDHLEKELPQNLHTEAFPDEMISMRARALQALADARRCREMCHSTRRAPLSATASHTPNRTKHAEPIRSDPVPIESLSLHGKRNIEEAADISASPLKRRRVGELVRVKASSEERREQEAYIPVPVHEGPYETVDITAEVEARLEASAKRRRVEAGEETKQGVKRKRSVASSMSSVSLRRRKGDEDTMQEVKEGLKNGENQSVGRRALNGIKRTARGLAKGYGGAASVEVAEVDKENGGRSMLADDQASAGDGLRKEIRGRGRVNASERPAKRSKV